MKTSLLLLALASLLAGLPAAAHDTWFEPAKDPVTGRALLALGTGKLFPVQETGIGREYIARQGCSRVQPAPRSKSTPLRMKALRNSEQALILAVPPGAGSCWMQLQPFDVTVEADKVPLYLQEIQATPEVRAIWAQRQQRGLPWKERYTKHARVDLKPQAGDAGPSPALGLDLQRLPGDGALRAGDSIRARVLRDGQPLPGLAVQARHEASAVGIWRRSDEHGMVTLPLPLAGRWVLRGVDLRVSEREADAWDSRFVTLAFEVGPPDQNGSSLISNSRSTSQASASAAISSEPPVSTARR